MAPKSAAVKSLLNFSYECEYSDSTRQMVAAGLPLALRSTKEERHAFQETVCSQADKMLRNMEAKLQAKVDLAKEKAEKAQADMDGLKAAVDSATSEMEKVAAVVKEKEEKANISATAKDDIKLELEKVEQVKRQLEKEKARLDKEKTLLTDFEAGPYKTCIEGSAESEKELDKFAKKCVTTFGKFGAEQALLVAVHAVLTSSPDERKGFDMVVIENLNGILSERNATIDTKTSENSTKMTECLTEFNEKTALLEGAKAVCDTDDEALSSCKAELDERTQDLAKAREAVSSYDEEAEKINADAETAKAELELLADVLTEFDAAVNRSSAPVESPPAPEAVDADGDATMAA